MSLVKWCSAFEINDHKDCEVCDAVPVIPLSALTEVVEVLQYYAQTAIGARACDVLSQLEAHGKEGV